MGPVANVVKNMGNGVGRSVGQTVHNGPLVQMSKRCASNLAVASQTTPLIS